MVSVTPQHVIDTGGTPYALCFAPDGRRLAIGVGDWYAYDSGLIVAALPSLETREIPTRGCSLSALRFDDAGARVFASAWGAGRSPSPALVIDTVGGAAHKLVATASVGTGLCAHRGQLFVRSAGVANPFLPISSEGLRIARRDSHLYHSRVVGVGDALITGADAGPESGDWRSIAGRERSLPRARLVTRSLATGAIERVETPHLGRICSIAKAPAGDAYVTGGLLGELYLWPEGRLLDTVPTADERRLAGVQWLSFGPQSVVALCFDHTGARLFAVSAGGVVVEYHDLARVRSWRIEGLGSPRSIAAHPRRSLLAIGVKRPSPRPHVEFRSMRPSHVALFET